MPMASVTLRPGVDVQRTFSLNEAGVSQAQLIRYKEGLIETYGGWQSYVPFTATSTVRDSHVWQDAATLKHLALAGTGSLSIITSCAASDITPTVATTNNIPNFSISSATNVITITDSAAIVSPYNSIWLRTPISIGNILLSGIYGIASVLSSVSYTIISSIAPSTTIASSGLTPLFTTSSGTSIITVNMSNNNYQAVSGLFYPFYAATTISCNVILIQGPYEVASVVVPSSTFTINSHDLAPTSSSKRMNDGNAQIEYFVTVGPQVSGSGYGAGGYGLGGYGSGSGLTGGGGIPIMAEDWSLDNWGSVLIACQKDGPIYTWADQTGFQTASIIETAPIVNGGIFVSMPQQILVAWKSTQPVSESQGNLQVRWSDAGDYTNWTIAQDTAAGSFVIPNGSVIRGALQASTQGLLWTDIGVWVMRYIGGDLIFNFSEVASGCGLVGQHAVAALAGNVYWMSDDNFYMLSGEGAVPIRCTVWDFVFQNINRTYISRVKCATNAAFNEVMWYFPSVASTGENDSYVKYNVIENEWDYGTLARTTWVDVSVLGMPIAVDPTGAIYQHETGEVTSGVSVASFRSGWWSISEGNDFAFVDYIIPDFKFERWAIDANATIRMTFFTADYPQDTPRTYGPYTVTSTTQYLSPRMRGRLMSVLIEGDGLNWWRLGRIRYRFAQAGRR